MRDSLTSLVPLSLIERLLGVALAQGGDFAEIYVERARGNSIALEEEKIRTAAYGVSLGVGVRVIAGTEVGYAYSDDLEPKALEEAARVASHIARGGKSAGAIRVSLGIASNFSDVDAFVRFAAELRDQTRLTLGEVTFDIESCRVIRDGS